MLKCSRDRCVCAPQSLSAGTLTGPRLSCSTRVAVIVSSLALRSWMGSLRILMGRVQRRTTDDQRFSVAAEGYPDQVAVEPGDELHRDCLRAHGLALGVVGAAAEILAGHGRHHVQRPL